MSEHEGDEGKQTHSLYLLRFSSVTYLTISVYSGWCGCIGANDLKQMSQSELVYFGSNGNLMVQVQIVVSESGQFYFPRPVSLARRPIKGKRLAITPRPPLVEWLLQAEPFDVEIRCLSSSPVAEDSSDVATTLHPPSVTVLRAHGSVLCRLSPVFKAMLEGPMSESHSGVIEISDVPHDVMREVLRYMYLNKRPRDLDVLLDTLGEGLLYAAIKYELSGLVNICTEYFIHHISDANVLSLYRLATMRMGLDTLKRATTQYISNHSDDVVYALLESGESGEDVG